MASEREKSWGRELSVLLLSVLMIFAFKDQQEIVKILVWPIFTLTFWSFGVVRNDESIAKIIGTAKEN